MTTQQLNIAVLESVLAGSDSTEREDFKTIWTAAGAVPQAGRTDADQEARVRRALAALAVADSASRTSFAQSTTLRRVVITRVSFAVAAAALVAAVAVTLWLQPVSRSAGTGERIAVSLPDGSNVTLRDGASISYPRFFGRSREVSVEGEAFFDVAHDGSPFHVMTFNAEVEVMGTRFNVRAWPEGMDRTTTVTLESGSVALSSTANPNAQSKLVPGETKRVLSDGTVEDVSGLALADALAWRSGALIYHDEKLGVVLEDIERRFGISLTLQPASLDTVRMTFSSHNPAGVESVITTLCAPHGLRFRETSDGYQLYDPD